MTEDLYLILGIGRSASVNEIKKAYRKLARRYHPDINPGDRAAEERFKKISEAYEILSDARKRRFYDEHGFYTEGVLEERADTHSAFSFRGFDFSATGKSAFGDILGDLFARHAARHEPERGADLEYQISMSFEESVRGIRTQLSVRRKQVCPTCAGSGRAPGNWQVACSHCSGTGQVPRVRGHLQFDLTCPVCNGAGRVSQPCPDCQGEGRIAQDERLQVDIPPGVSTGSRVRVEGKGDAGRHGGPPGDLYVVTNVSPHPFFRRMGDNLYCTVPITITEAALGAKIEVPTLDGPATMRIPPGTQTGQTFRLRGRGAPSLLNPGMRGDQYVEVRVLTPQVHDERSKEILRELTRLNPARPRAEILELYGSRVLV